MVTGGTAIGKIPGALTKLTVKNGAAVGQDRTISMYGINGILPADSTEITDAEFLRNVSANETFQSMDMQTKKAGLDATVALKEPLQVLRVPAGAVFGIDGSSGCIVPKSHNASNTPVKVTIVGSELGVRRRMPTCPRSPTSKSAAGSTGWFANSRRTNRKKPLSFAKQCENRMKPPIRERI